MNLENLTDTKKIIRSLLISTKHGLFPKQLEHDYFSLKGTSIPYSEYGHRTLESFLFSIPDVVHISRQGSLLRLTGVPTSETFHINWMVQQQSGTLFCFELYYLQC